MGASPPLMVEASLKPSQVQAGSLVRDEAETGGSTGSRRQILVT